MTSGTKFLFGGNIRDPLNLNALSHDEIERRKSDGILQPKKFEGIVFTIELYIIYSFHTAFSITVYFSSNKTHIERLENST